MRYCMLDGNGFVVNIIESDAFFANKIGACVWHEGIKKGEKYVEPQKVIVPTTEQQLMQASVDHELRLAMLELGL